MNTRQRMIAPLVGLLALVGAAIVPAARPDKPAKDATVVPFVMLPSNHMVVECKINGKGPYKFIFDLGAPVTLLSNKAAEATGAVKANAPKSILLATRGEVQVRRLQVGELTAERVPAIVMDHPALKALGSAFDQKLDGIIGYTFWAHYRMAIDYQAKRLSFTPVEFEVRNLMKDMEKRLTGPKVAKRVMLAPHGLWGIILGKTPGGIDQPGVPIETVLTDSPAASAGLKAGDVLTAIDGRWTTSVTDAFAAAATIAPGQTVPVVVLRDGQALTLPVTPQDGI